MEAPETANPAKAAYEALAPAYDDFTVGYMANSWTAKLLDKAMHHGLLNPGRLLDVACGTGKSFLPMIERGWTVTGCDISPAMVEIARVKIDGKAEVTVADMQQLPVLGSFDLVWALNDSVNYLLSTSAFEAALVGMRDNLAPGGLLVFDANSLHTYRTTFAQEATNEVNGRRMTWKGLAAPDTEPTSICEARVEAEDDSIEPNVHRQRHFPEEIVLDALDRAELQCLDVWGELEGVLSQPLDESLHTKAVYIARAPS